MSDNIEVRVAVLEKELSQVTGLFDRLDLTIDKLTDVSNSINRLLAIHETKINSQEDAQRDIYHELELRRRETDNVYSFIKKEIHETEIRICAEIESLSKRTSIIEKWRWLIVGGAAVIGFAVSLFAKSLGISVNLK